MDGVLKARTMASASGQPQKMQQRELDVQRDEGERTDILLGGYSSDEDDLSDEGDSYSPIPDTQSDHLPPTSKLSSLSKHPSATLNSHPAQLRASSMPLLPSLSSKPYLPKLVIHAPLSLDSNIHQAERILPADHADAPPFSIEPETPIEIATPVFYSIPHARPSMISIKTSTSQSAIDITHRPLPVQHPPPIPQRSVKRGSTQNLRIATPAVQPPMISLPMSSSPAFNKVSSTQEDLYRHSTAPMSAKSESALQCRSPSYDLFSQTITSTSSHKTNPPMLNERQSQSPLTKSSIFVHSRRTSSFPTILTDPTSNPDVPFLAEARSKKSPSTLRRRRSSIGLALRNVSSSWRSKATGIKPSSSSPAGTAGSMELQDGVIISAFPMPPPSPLLQQSLQQEPESPSILTGRSRLKQVRTTMGL